MTSAQNSQAGMKHATSLKSLVTTAMLALALVGCKDGEVLPSSLPDDVANQAYVSILESQLSSLPPNGQVAIALVHEGNTEFLGVRNENNVLRGIDNADWVFEIGSITKVFTGICLAAMIDSREASLTETLQSQFDFPLQAGGDITLEQLANHTSGLPVVPTNVDEVQGYVENDPYAIYTHENLKSYLQNHVVLDSESGTHYQYSNLGTGLLGYTLAQKRNSTFEEMLQSTIFTPLEMTSTTTLLDNVEASRLVKPMDIQGNEVSYWNFAETMSGAGSVKSTVADLAKFMEKNFEDDPWYSLPQTKTFTVNQSTSMGLGWVIIEEEDFTIHLHDGGTGGFSSLLLLDKQKRIGVVVLSNVENYHQHITPMANDFLLEIND
ncbi:MAG: serine hydrolase domain-containing protein [Bacteroidota bacterium]